MKNHASLDRMSAPQLAKHFFGVILQKNLVAHPCNAFCCHRSLCSYSPVPGPLAEPNYFHDCSRRCLAADYLLPI